MLGGGGTFSFLKKIFLMCNANGWVTLPPSTILVGISGESDLKCWKLCSTLPVTWFLKYCSVFSLELMTHKAFSSSWKIIWLLGRGVEVMVWYSASILCPRNWGSTWKGQQACSMFSEHLIMGMCKCVVFLSRVGGGHCKAIIDISCLLLVPLVEFERLT